MLSRHKSPYHTNFMVPVVDVLRSHLASLVNLDCFRLLYIACSSYLPSLSLSSCIKYFYTAVCPLCNMPASLLLLMQVRAPAVIGVVSWTLGLPLPLRRCSLHPSCGRALLLGPLPRLGSQHSGNPMMTLAGMAISFGCLGLQLVSGISCWVSCLNLPCSMLCISGHSPPRFFAPRALCALCAGHQAVCCNTCSPLAQTVCTRHDLPDNPTFLRVMLLALPAKPMDAFI